GDAYCLLKSLLFVVYTCQQQTLWGNCIVGGLLACVLEGLRVGSLERALRGFKGGIKVQSKQTSQKL
ncbi:MAG TPA: hypothetical protein VM124_00390, partial [Candidatus Limnocylindrales bacterium]|nr:hypothetical protein [Candidatus Limnocylindrales bacterium]